VTSPDSVPLDIHVVAHTHWDREWYHAASRFRQRLVPLVASILSNAPDRTRPFLLDGQAVVLEDVLAVHPEWEAALRDQLSSGALEAGPWYVLADELIPSGEALVRNLLAGRRVLARLGATPPAACYSPDSFGHPAMLPAIARGFGLKVAVLWRGYGSARFPAGDSARWQAPDGSEMPLWHLPRDGYEYGSALPVDTEQARTRWQRLHAELASRSTTGVVLLTNGADHHALQPRLDEAIGVIGDAARANGAHVRRSSLTAWARAFEAAVAQRALPVVRGELRDSYGFTWTLQGTLATRAWQKRAVARADALLRWDVEPWMALASLHTGNTSSPGLLHAAWKTLLRTLPHDTLCGCSVDSVARALDGRVASVRTQAIGLRTSALDVLHDRDASAARDVPADAWSPRMLVRNRATRPRWGVAEAELCTTIGDVRVGPGSNLAEYPSTQRLPVVRDVPDGLLVQPLHARLRHERRESPHHYPDDDVVHALRALVWIPEHEAVPATGSRNWHMRPNTTADAGSTNETLPEAVAHRDENGVHLQNTRLRINVSKGRVSLHDNVTGRTINDLLQLTWQRDVGDAYTSAPRGPILSATMGRPRIRARGPLRAIVEVSMRLLVPHTPGTPDLCFADEERSESAGHGDAPSVHTALNSSALLRPLRASIVLSLDAGASHLGVRVVADDRAPDHRLCVRIATDQVQSRVFADAAFTAVERSTVELSANEELMEHATACAPLHRWVARSDAVHTTCVVGDGLAEYEAFDNGAVAITLVRATGELSRANLPERPGHAGWPARIPLAQGPGRVRANFAVSTLSRYDVHEIEHLADNVLRPLVAHTWRDAPRIAPPVARGIELIGDGIVASAIKPADDGNGVILRAVNVRSEAREAVWRVPYNDVHAESVRLDETSDTSQVHMRTVDGHTEIRTLVPPRAISSVRVRRLRWISSE
jgi:hypothetical protein